MSGKRIDPDTEVFREAMRGVKPIAARPRVSPVKRKPPAKARFTAADRAMVLVESLQGPSGDITDTGDEISFRRAGVQDGILRKLRRGEYRVEEICDLHGLRVEEAKAALREFLADALAHNLRCVRIIHGKGMNSGPRGPVIKTAVNMILRKTGPVLAFTSARRVDGGTGAINVLLGAAPFS
ncbi:MAG TPA: Smr/MutS family protein [Steroidobacteraceae bacterium]|nr:Smr/MutS family protein [Steroidobacteraceae bacterium]